MDTAAHNDQQFIDDVMERVRSFLTQLERGETLLVLQSLKDALDQEISWAVEDASRRKALLTEIAGCSDYGRLAGIHGEFDAHEMDSFLKIQSVADLHRHCTDYRDHLASRTVELVVREMAGDPPVPFALISMGSDGREEQTLITDQDYLVVYGDDGGAEADEYFAAFSLLLVERLAEIGFKKCTGDIMPSNPTWRGSYAQWRRKLLSIVRYEYDDYGKNLMDLIVLSDARYVAGDRDLAERLIGLLRDLERDYFQVLWGMAKAATEMKLALGFLKRFWTEGGGEHKGEFNLKLLAWAPLVMNVRILAINQGIPASSTLRRIELLQQEGSFSSTMAKGLTNAYLILTRYRILLQIKVIKGIQKDAHYLNPYGLPTEERERIRHALIRIEELQKIIHTNFSIM